MTQPRCQQCGTDLLDPGGICPTCGRRSKTVLTPDPIVLHATVPPPSTISDHHDPRTGDAQIRVTDPSVRSESHADAGTISLDVEGAGTIGRPNEGRVAELTLQITTVPSAPEFWRAAHRSSARTEVSEQHAHEWLRTAIATKAARLPQRQRASTVLAIDARHAGVLGTPALIDRYLASFGSPSSEFGLASVWVVGPTPKYCRRVGSGSP